MCLEEKERQGIGGEALGRAGHCVHISSIAHESEVECPCAGNGPAAGKCGSEFPLPRGIHSDLRKIPAWARVLKARVGHISVGGDIHAHKDIDPAVNGLTCGGQHPGHYALRGEANGIDITAECSWGRRLGRVRCLRFRLG